MDENIPKNAGDRGFGHGNTITLTLDGGSVAGGEWVTLNGDGTVSPGGEDGVAKHSREDGEELAVHLAGVVRAVEDNAEADTTLVYDGYDNGDVLVRLR